MDIAAGIADGIDCYSFSSSQHVICVYIGSEIAYVLPNAAGHMDATPHCYIFIYTVFNISCDSWPIH